MKNYTKGKRTKTFVEVKAPLKHSDKVKEELSKSAQENEKVIQNPEPNTSISGIEDSSAKIELDCFVGSSKEVGKARSSILEDFSNNKKIKEIFS